MPGAWWSRFKRQTLLAFTMAGMMLLCRFLFVDDGVAALPVAVPVAFALFVLTVAGLSTLPALVVGYFAAELARTDLQTLVAI